MAFDREYATFSTAQSVAMSSGYAYVAVSYFRLHVIDLTNPTLPICLHGAGIRAEIRDRNHQSARRI